MAIEIQHIRICDRCWEGGVETEAEVVDKYTLNGFKFEQDLCRDHSAELYNLIMHTWGDSATQTGEPTVFDKPIRLSTAPTPQPAELAAVEAKAETPALTLVGRPELPHTAQRWTLSTHAEEQMRERGFELYDVLMACERSQTVSPNQEHRDPGTQLRRYGRCLVSVDPTTFRVVTVMVAGETKHSWNRKQAEKAKESTRVKVEA